MIRLNVFIRTTDSNREEVVNTAKELVAASLKDEGCVAYDLFESTTRKDVLMICDYYGIGEITLEDANRIHEDYIKARRSWIAEIRKDAEKEFAMGDVEEEVFRNFVDSLDQEIEYEN